MKQRLSFSSLFCLLKLGLFFSSSVPKLELVFWLWQSYNLLWGLSDVGRYYFYSSNSKYLFKPWEKFQKYNHLSFKTLFHIAQKSLLWQSV